MTTHLLFESASGYTLYELLAVDEIGQSLDAVQQSVTSLERFSKVNSKKLRLFLKHVSKNC